MSRQTIAVSMLPIATLQPDPKNARKVKQVEELSNDIKRRGVLVPLLVRRQGEMYMIVDGHRRYAAAVGLDKLPCVILPPDVTEEEVREAQLVTQLHSEALTPFEIYTGAKNWLALRVGATAKELAAAISRSEGLVSMVLSLDRCIQEVKDAAAAGRIGLKDWYSISQADEQKQREMLARKLSPVGGGMKQVKCLMPSGITVTVGGKETGMTMEQLEATLVELLKEVRRGKNEGLDSKTFAAVMRDKARN